MLQFNSRSKVDAVRQKVESVKNTMSNNIDKARPLLALWRSNRISKEQHRALYID